MANNILRGIDGLLAGCELGRGVELSCLVPEHHVQGVQQQPDAGQLQAAPPSPLLLRLVLLMLTGQSACSKPKIANKAVMTDRE
jgi:hypothetical protein